MTVRGSSPAPSPAWLSGVQSSQAAATCSWGSFFLSSGSRLLPGHSTAGAAPRPPCGAGVIVHWRQGPWSGEGKAKSGARPSPMSIWT